MVGWKGGGQAQGPPPKYATDHRRKNINNFNLIDNNKPNNLELSKIILNFNELILRTWQKIMP